MRLRKNYPIDLNSEYPCPCRRKGKLLPIVLTEAMGCELCQNIFVLSAKGESIEQINLSYPYKKAWYWTGKKWISKDKTWQENYFFLGIVCFSVFSILILTPLLISLKGAINLIFAIIVGLIIILLSLSLWFAYHR